MDKKEAYLSAKELYAALGVDTDAAIMQLKEVPVSLHCWQGDDVTGFDHDGPLTGGIQTTGNYPGRARTPQELMQDMDQALKLMPGKKKLNLHASYAIFEDGEFVDRDRIEPKHFAKWVAFAKERNMGIDFNPTFFSHDRVKDGLTLSSPDKETRKFWIDHGRACIRISEYFAKETGIPCVMNIWTGDGYKDIPADRLEPRLRYRDSLEQILAEPFDKSLVKPCVESKVFGIGVESYTVGSAEFALSFAASHNGCLPLMDNGHYHPTEMVSDKIPALLVFFPEIALHITRPVRWDSDHVVLFDDETREMAKEIVRSNALGRVYMALDYFDAGINRIAAWTVGFRSWQKALLNALCIPNEKLRVLQDENRMTELMILQEEMKTCPFGAVWDEYCRQCGAPEDRAWFGEVVRYEEEVLSLRPRIGK
jgi:L-rhamnose isomerase